MIIPQHCLANCQQDQKLSPDMTSLCWVEWRLGPVNPAQSCSRAGNNTTSSVRNQLTCQPVYSVVTRIGWVVISLGTRGGLGDRIMS